MNLGNNLNALQQLSDYQCLLSPSFLEANEFDLVDKEQLDKSNNDAVVAFQFLSKEAHNKLREANKKGYGKCDDDNKNTENIYVPKFSDDKTLIEMSAKWTRFSLLCDSKQTTLLDLYMPQHLKSDPDKDFMNNYFVNKFNETSPRYKKLGFLYRRMDAPCKSKFLVCLLTFEAILEI